MKVLPEKKDNGCSKNDVFRDQCLEKVYEDAREGSVEEVT